MKNQSIRESIIIGVFVLGIFALVGIGTNADKTSEEVTYYPITETQSANVLGAVDSVANIFDGSIPDCVSSVTNSSNSNNCVVSDCSDPPNTSIGDSHLTAEEISDCVEDTPVSNYSDEQLGCLAGQCLMHGTFSSSSTEVVVRKSEVADEEDTPIPDCIESFVNTPPTSINDPGSCSVEDCDNTTITYEGSLSDDQMDGCLGDTPMADATYAQLGCLANECINHTSYSDTSTSLTPTKWQDLTIGSKDPLVYTLEYELKQKGFFTLVPDTVFGYKTMDGIKLFQASVRLPATGILDQKTVTELLK